MEPHVSSIDELIAQLQTEEGKARALARVVERGIINSPDYTERAIQTCIRVDLVILAANLALKSGNIERAIEIYERGKLPSKAGELAEKSGQLVRASSVYENAGLTRKAADIVFNLGLREEAIKICVRCKDFFYAAELAEKIGDTERAQSFTQRGSMGTEGQYEPAGISWSNFREARAAEKRKDYRLAGGLYERDGLFMDAMNAFAYAGDYSRAAINAEKARMFRAAADSYVKLKDFPKAILNYDKSGMFGICADLCKKTGDIKMEKVYRKLVELLK